MSDSNAIRTGIFDKATATGAFNTAIGGRFYFSVAPDNATYPYCVCHLLDEVYDFEFVEEFEEVTVLFAIFDETDGSSVNIGSIKEKLCSLFDWSTLTIDGYTSLKMQRDFSKLDWDGKLEKWVYQIEFSLLIEKN